MNHHQDLDGYQMMLNHQWIFLIKYKKGGNMYTHLVNKSEFIFKNISCDCLRRDRTNRITK